MATKLVSPTTTATISLSSGDITSNPLNINCTYFYNQTIIKTVEL